MNKFIILCVLLCTYQAQAKIWRINNTAGVAADFTTGQAAINSSSVVNDDTLHFEGSTTNYPTFVINKRVVIIGTGYFLDGTNSNTGLQANTKPAILNTIYIDTLASGSTIMGVQFSDGIYSNYTGTGYGGNLGADNITISRCYIGSSITLGYSSAAAGADYTGWVINKCYIAGYFSAVSR